MLALQINIQKILLYISVPKNIALSCSSGLTPFVISPRMKAITPMAIKTIDHVFILEGISNCSLNGVIVFFLSISIYFFVTLVSVAGAFAAMAAACLDLIYAIIS